MERGDGEVVELVARLVREWKIKYDSEHGWLLRQTLDSA
jgi:hypothetical protein